MSEPDIRTILGYKPTFAEKVAIEFHREHPETDIMKCIKIARKATEEWSATTDIKVSLEQYIRDSLILEFVKEKIPEKHGRGYKISEETKEAVRIDAANGMSTAEISQKYGIGKTSVKRITSEYNYLVSARKTDKKEPLEMTYISHFETEEPPSDKPMPPPEEEESETTDQQEPEPEKKKSLAEILVEMGESMGKMIGSVFTEPSVSTSDNTDIPEDDGADMFMMLTDLREFIEEHFGEHIPYDMRCDNKVGMAQYHFREPRSGKAYRISIYETTEEDQDEVEEDDYDE